MNYVALHYRFSYISTGKFDTRGRPIPGLAKLPQVQSKSKQPYSASNMLPQGAGFTQSLSILKNSNANSDGPGKIYVGGMPPSLSEPHLHVYFSQFGIVKNVTIIRSEIFLCLCNSTFYVQIKVFDITFSLFNITASCYSGVFIDTITIFLKFLIWGTHLVRIFKKVFLATFKRTAVKILINAFRFTKHDLEKT